MGANSMQIQELSTADDRDQCVRMMLASNPWNMFYFSYDQCARDLADSQTLVHVARDGTGQVIGGSAQIWTTKDRNWRDVSGTENNAGPQRGLGVIDMAKSDAR